MEDSTGRRSEAVGAEGELAKSYLDTFDGVWSLMESRFRNAGTISIEFQSLTDDHYVGTEKIQGVLYQFPATQITGSAEEAMPASVLLLETGELADEPIRSMYVNCYILDGKVTMLSERCVIHLWPNGAVEFSGKITDPSSTSPKALRATGGILLRQLDHKRVLVHYDETFINPMPLVECDGYYQGVFDFSDEELGTVASHISFVDHILRSINPQTDMTAPDY